MKRECPVANGAGIEGTLYTLAEFLKIAKKLQFDIGPELFDNFRLVLRGALKGDWLNTLVDCNPPCMVDGFYQTIVNKSRSLLNKTTKRRTRSKFPMTTTR